MPLDRSSEVERLCSQVIGAAIEVHRHIGPGQMEAAYHRAMEIELTLRRVPFQTEFPVQLTYKGHPIGSGRIDLLIGDRALVVELKSVEKLAPVHDAQLLAYLRNVRCPLGLLLNFNVVLLKNGLRRLAI